MRFADIPDYQAIKQRLVHIVSNRQVPHAQLFTGPAGNGSLPLALAFITYLHCQQPSKDDACGCCTSCRQMKSLAHPSVQYIFPTSTSKQTAGKKAVSSSFLEPWRNFIEQHPYGSIDEWSTHFDGASKQLSIPREEAREIIRGVSLKTFDGGHKTTLIWLPEHLHATAANALLKVLEEPPLRTFFVLVSANTEKILSTIQSRTQQVYIPAFTNEAIESILTQQYTLTQEQLEQVTLLANGSFNKAEQLVKQLEGTYFDFFKQWMRLCYKNDWPRLLDQAESFHTWTKVEQSHFLIYALHLLRESLIGTLASRELTRVSTPEKEFAQNLGKTLPNEQLMLWISWINTASHQLPRNVNTKLLYTTLSWKIAQSFLLK